MIEWKDVQHLYPGVKMATYHTARFIYKLAYIYPNGGYDMPVLRPLEDINQEEEQYIQDRFGQGYQQTPSYLTQALREGTAFMVPSIVKVAKLTAYLLNRGFDLYGLIESGQAIDKTKI